MSHVAGGFGLDWWIDQLRNAVQRGVTVDLSLGESGNHPNPQESSAARTIPAAAVRAVLTDTRAGSDPRGLHIRGARFDEPVDLEAVCVSHPLRFTDCTFEQGFNGNLADFRTLGLLGVTLNGPLWLLATTVAGQLDLSGSTVRVSSGIALAFDDIRVAGDLYMRYGFRAEGGVVRGVGAMIGGSLDVCGAVLDNHAGQALLLTSARISRNVLAHTSFHANGEVNGFGLNVDGAFDISGAVIDNAGRIALNLERCAIAGGLVAVGLNATGSVRIIGSSIGSITDFSGATFANPGGQALSLEAARLVGGLLARNGFAADGEVNATAANIAGQLELTAGSFRNPDGRALVLDGAQIVGNILAQNNFRSSGEVSAFGLTVAGSVALGGGSADCPDRIALNFSGARISGGMIVSGGFNVRGEVRMLAADVGVSIEFDGAALENVGAIALSLDGTNAKAGFFMRGGTCVKGEVRAISATFGYVDLNSAVLACGNSVALRLNGARINGDLNAYNGFRVDGAVTAINVAINGQLNLQGASLRNKGGVSLSLDSASIGGNVAACRGFSVDGELRAVGAEIMGTLDLGHAAIRNPGGIALNLEQARVARGISAGDGFTAEGKVHIVGATVGSELDLTGATLDNRSAIALSLRSSTVLRLRLIPQMNRGTVDLFRSHIGDLVTGEQPPAPLDATGWEVGDLHGPLREDWRRMRTWLRVTKQHDTSNGNKRWLRCLSWLRRNDPVSVQPWYHIADVYDRNGYPAAARRLRFSAANTVTAQSPPLTRLMRATYCVIAGYGYYPLVAIFSVIALLLLGAAVVASNREGIVPTNLSAARAAYVANHAHFDHVATPETNLMVTADTPCADLYPRYPCMRTLTFTLNNLLPPAGSSIQDWSVAPNAPLMLVVGLPALKIGLWALTALLLAGVTGLLRRT